MKISIDPALVPQLIPAEPQPYAEILETKKDSILLKFQQGVTSRLELTDDNVNMAELFALSRRGRLYFEGTEAVRHTPAV